MQQSKCFDCGYEGKKGYWRGTAVLENGSAVPFEGKVSLDSQGETFELDEIIEAAGIDNEQIVKFDGEAFCPECDSANFY